MEAQNSKLKVLFICHNHPSIYPGGAEGYALEIYDEMRNSGEVEPIFLARVGKTASSGFLSHPGTPFSVLEADTHQYSMQSEIDDFEWLTLSQRKKEVFTVRLREFLLTHQPDVIHIQHTSFFIGYDLLPQAIRNTLPDAAIVYTLHEYMPICHRDGQMLRTPGNDELCLEASPRRCHTNASPRYRRRLLHAKAIHPGTSLCVDHSSLPVIPSREVRGMGDQRDRIQLRTMDEPNRSGRYRPRQVRDQFRFFGQLNPYKGLNILLEAMRVLANGTERQVDWRPEERNDHSDQGRTYSCTEPTSKGSPRCFKRRSGTGRGDGQQRHLLRQVRQDNLPALMDEIDWVRALDLVGELAARHPGGLPPRTTRDLQRHRWHGREGDPWGQRSALSRRRFPSLAQVIRTAVRSPGLWDQLRSRRPPIRTAQGGCRLAHQTRARSDPDSS